MTPQRLGPFAASPRSRKGFEAVFGVMLFIFAWEIIGRTEALTTSFPPLSDVMSVLIDPISGPRLWRALGTTMRAGLLGCAIGFGTAFLAVTAVRLVPWARRPAERFAVLVEAVPVIALGPLLMALLPREVLPTALAATAAYFAAFVAIGTGLWSRHPEHSDVFTAMGATRMTILTRLDLPATVPWIFAALQLSFPAALLGAVIGEWFGASSGIGPLLINSMQNYDIPVLWAAGVLTAVPTSIVYGAAGLFQGLSLRRFAL